MKKNYLYLLLILFFTGAVGFVVMRYETNRVVDSNQAFTILPRSGDANHAEWLMAKQKMDDLNQKIKANPADIKSLLALANAYIMESRVSGNISYYDKAAMVTVDKILMADAGNFDALLLRSLLQLSQHHFANGLATAEAAVKINANNSFAYGLLVDANVEMGNYEAAVDAADKMISIRPDLRSYARIAYLREIHGDYPGAVDAMKLAVEAGVPGEEPTEWCRIQLGRLYENMGLVKEAKFQYELSLAARPGYAYAFAGLGRIASFEKKADSAIYFFTQAMNFTNDVSVKEGLALAYKAAGETKKADELQTAVINEMTKNANAGNNDPTLGHYSDKELAYAYLQNNNYDKALEHALAEYNRRPKNIDANETVAWVYLNRKEFSKAFPYAEASTTTHSMNPELLCIAGLVYLQNGETVKAKQLLTLGLKHNAVMREDIKSQSIESLKKI